MRILLFADVHGNVAALDAVLADRHRRGPFDLIACAGDLVWAGPRPRQAMARLRELCDDDPLGGSGVVCVQGNTDLFLEDAYGHHPPKDKRHKRFLRHRTWMLEQLTPSDLTFLRRMPFGYRVSPAPGRDLLIVHANPHNLDDPIFADMSDEEIAAVVGELDPFAGPGTAGACASAAANQGPVRQGADLVDFAVLAYGHIHVPSVRRWRGRLLVNVASVGLPRDGDVRAAYSVLTWQDGAWQVEQHRVAYDVAKVAEDMRSGGLPRGKHFARRLLAAQYD